VACERQQNKTVSPVVLIECYQHSAMLRATLHYITTNDEMS